MTTLLLSVVVGIGTGVAANLVTHLFISVWLPAYRNYVYRGVRVHGGWTVVQPHEAADGRALSSEWEVTLAVQQHAYTLRGIAVSTRRDGGSAVDVLHYDITGYVRDRFVVILLTGKDHERISHSTFHLEVVGDGTQMVGYRTFYGALLHKIRAVEVTLYRNRSIDLPAPGSGVGA